MKGLTISIPYYIRKKLLKELLKFYYQILNKTKERYYSHEYVHMQKTTPWLNLLGSKAPHKDNIAYKLESVHMGHMSKSSKVTLHNHS